MTIGFIGFGNMASAIASGIIKAGIVHGNKIYAYDVLSSKIDEFKAKYDVNSVDSLSAVVSICDIIVLAVKPQNYNEVLNGISGLAIDGKIFVSIAAGISIKKIKSIIGRDTKVVRVMPNTPLLLGCGATAACRCKNTTDSEFATVCSLFECSGTVSVLDESKMNEVISVNGSSPAYIFLFAKAVCEYAESCGIDYDSAKKLFAQTLIGSAKMMIESGDDLQTLIDKVTSKGGTTAKALEQFYASDFEGIIKSAMGACTARANELGQE